MTLMIEKNHILIV